VVSADQASPLHGGAWLLAEAAKNSDKLPPPTRAILLMALLGIALIGLMFVVAILLGGHWVRRQGAFRRWPAVPADRLPLASPSTAAQTAAERSPQVAGDLPHADDTQTGARDNDTQAD
jgi:hypothetical protein